jgi:hypothetical protein
METKNKLFANFLLFSLFGIALGFFGMLYEAVVIIPKMLDATSEKMLFWHSYYSIINPMVYYIPIVPVATILLVLLYFSAATQSDFKKWIGRGLIFQLITLGLTVYIISQINLKLYFGNIEKYAEIIPTKTFVINVLSIVRLVFSAIALFIVFKTYIKTQQKPII